jgi:hypothetical protein
MIIGLLTLAYLIFSGGHQTFLLDPALKKNVDTYVTDSKRKDAIYGIIKTTEKDEVKFDKEVKSVFDKKLVSINMNAASTVADFNTEYQKFYDSLSSLQNAYVANEIKIRTYIKPQEWDNIMSKVATQPDPAKTRKDLMEENQKMAAKLQSACNKYITDPASKKQSESYVNGYKAKGDSVVNAFLDLNYKYLTALKPYLVTAATFLPLRSRMMEVRKSYSNYLVDMRFKLKSLTPSDKWKELAKELNNNFTYMGAGISK